ncbi:MAG: agmatine deiminase [Steroidobacteraceae bacterium]
MSSTLITTPAADGFYMPAEFVPHRGTWLLWPERGDTWRLGAKPAQQAFVAVATAIASSESVSVGVSQAQFTNARALLPENVRVVEMSHNDAWMRDMGPTCVVNKAGEVRGVDWMFNAWGGLQGGLYFPWDQDDLVAQKVLEVEGLVRYRAPLVLEGGAIHVDGQGTALVTEECLLNPNRNPDMDIDQIELLLHEYLGVSTVIWLGQGVYNDETDGHIDNLCCFIKLGEVALTWTDNKRDPQYARSNDALRRLQHARDARGRKLKVNLLPQPDPLYLTDEEAAGLDALSAGNQRFSGDRLAASYVNFYIGNSVVIVPLLDKRHDRTVLSRLRRWFPKRKVIGIPAREIVLGGGGIHCITQQIPR